MKKIEIEKIRQNVSAKHEKFVKEAGWQSKKLGADYTYNLERMGAKVRFILNIFEESKVISGYEENDNNGINSGKRSLRIKVEGYENVVDIDIFDSYISISEGSHKSPILKANNINVGEIDEYDWEDFANRLLEYIHQTIYMRKESYELKIWGD